MRQGHLKAFVPYVFPLTLGWDFSGVIEGLGSQVSSFAVGDAVFSRPDVRRDGSYAEYIVVRAVELARKPKTISHVEAASIPLAGITAWESIVAVGTLAPGQTALIHAASGSVGSLAVQIAKWRGAHVIATTSKANVELVRSLGADQVIDYRNERFAEKVKDVDLVVDPIGGEVQASSWSVLRRGGILVSTVSVPSLERAAALGVRSAHILIGPDAAVLNRLAGLVELGQVANPDWRRVRIEGHRRGACAERVRSDCWQDRPLCRPAVNRGTATFQTGVALRIEQAHVSV